MRLAQKQNLTRRDLTPIYTGLAVRDLYMQVRGKKFVQSPRIYIQAIVFLPNPLGFDTAFRYAPSLQAASARLNRR